MVAVVIAVVFATLLRRLRLSLLVTAGTGGRKRRASTHTVEARQEHNCRRQAGDETLGYATHGEQHSGPPAKRSRTPYKHERWRPGEWFNLNPDFFSRTEAQPQ
jgi:hypothetical protein